MRNRISMMSILIFGVFFFTACSTLEKKNELKPELKPSQQMWYGLTITPTGDLEKEENSILKWEDKDLIKFPGFSDIFVETEDEATVSVKDNGEFDGKEIAKHALCVVLSARLVFNAAADNPLFFPIEMTSPAPGQQAIAARRQTGPSVGPVPNTNPQQYRNSTSFEYHSELNGIHGCRSRQFSKTMDGLIQKQQALIGLTNGGGFNIPSAPDTDASYRGNTRTGMRNVQNAVIYEGQPDVIHWLDSPGSSLRAGGQLAPFANMDVTLLESKTLDSTGQHGWLCLSGHTAITDLANGQPMAPAAARLMLNQLAPNGGAAAPQALQNAAGVLGTPATQGGFQGLTNPEFRDLGCYSF